MINPVITLKWTLLVITLTRANADDTHGNERRATSADGAKKIVCYYTNWSVYRPGTAEFSPQNIDPYLCTHLIYAFGQLDNKNGLQPFDKEQDIEQGGYAKFTGLKTYNKNLKTMLAIGGWNEGSANFSALVTDIDRRAIFVKNVVKFLRQYNFDGLDLDWDYPTFRDGSKPEDKENYASLVKELREEFERESSKTGRPRLQLTMTGPSSIEYIDKGYDIPELNKYLDFMNILSYDYHSAYKPNVNHHSPLYSLQEESEYDFDDHLTIDHTVKHYLKKGLDREKLILGIPTYGRSWKLVNADSTDLGSPANGPGEKREPTGEDGFWAYYEICNFTQNDKQWTVVQPKTSAMGPYAYRANEWVSYDDADIVKLKAKYVNEKGLGGIMYWTIDTDDFTGNCHGKRYPLIEAGKESLLAGAASASEGKRPSKLANKPNRPRAQNPSSTSTTTKQPLTTSTATTFNALSTPEPPTTPDPGTDFVCKDKGFFPHPWDCKKFFWCLDSGPSNLGIVAHQFTCPTGLEFNKDSDTCDYTRNVICNKKSEKSTATTITTVKTTSVIPSTTSKAGTKIAPRTTSTTTTSTTTESSSSLTDVDSQEDPKAIKQLGTLIKKLGGIAELEKQLMLEDGSVKVISKTLYNKVFSSPVSNRNKSSPQHEAIPSNDDVPYYRKDKPQYVTIQRNRPSGSGAADVPTTWEYTVLSFLKEVVEKRPSKSNLNIPSIITSASVATIPIINSENTIGETSFEEVSVSDAADGSSQSSHSDASADILRDEEPEHVLREGNPSASQNVPNRSKRLPLKRPIPMNAAQVRMELLEVEKKKLALASKLNATKTTDDVEDPDKNFFLALLGDFKKLSPKKKMLCKIQLQTVVLEHYDE